MNIVSFSLWGDGTKYTVGAIKNAGLVSTWYRGWQARFYCDTDTVPQPVLNELAKMPHVLVVPMSASKEPHWGMFWRFYAAEDTDADWVVFRDTDSRVTQREAMAVQQWISTGKGFHSMRDHTQHGTPIMGGMWGVRKGRLMDIRSLIDAYYDKGLTKTAVFGIDQDFLTHSVWPRTKGDLVEHDDFFAKNPFPFPRDPRHFVGQVYDENDNPQF